MVSFTVRLRFAQDDMEQVVQQLRALSAASRLEPGCVTYVVHTVEGSADTILIYEQYVDRAALEAHRASKHFNEYGVKGFYQLMKDRQIEDLVAIS